MTELVNGKAVKFRTLAEQRVSRVLKLVRMIGKLSRRSSYEYSEAQVEQMFGAMHKELEEAEEGFAAPKQREFSFHE